MSQLSNLTVLPAPHAEYVSTVKNSSYVIPGVYDLSVEDTNWVLTSSFIIFTMQTGELQRHQDIRKFAQITFLMNNLPPNCLAFLDYLFRKKNTLHRIWYAGIWLCFRQE